MYLIVGLGNPGPRYENTRHNLGFIVLDQLALSCGIRDWREEGGGLVATGSLRGSSVVLIKPQTYMNLSGECVGRLVRYYKVPVQSVIVVHDELDVPFGSCKVKCGGGDAGHNGLKSITSHLGSADYVRFRVGIGRPPHKSFAIEDWVLSRFSASDESTVSELKERTLRGIVAFIESGLAEAQRAVVNKGSP